MKNSKSMLLILLFVLGNKVVAAPAYVMPNTHMHPLSTPNTINKDYLLYVHLPRSYEVDKKVDFPVLYLLDPWWDFPVVAGSQSGLVYDGVIPAMIIIGIGYADLSADPNLLRNSDYTPTLTTSLPKSGDASAFLQFINEDIIPFIENQYRVDESFRVLAGSSHGGLFTLFTLFKKPTLFQGHIAISPAVSYNHRWLFQRESIFFAKNDSPTLNTNLYMTVGSHDQIDNFTNETIAFNNIIKDRPYSKFNYKFEVRKNEHHASVKLGAFSQGLTHAFSTYKRSKK
ncbi:MAG: alpha/beta hydrolase [Pseudomonadales bacterium]|nr:alpha/beta hydrolase [Pseudomonadales bacterium]